MNETVEARTEAGREFLGNLVGRFGGAAMDPGSYELTVLDVQAIEEQAARLSHDRGADARTAVKEALRGTRCDPDEAELDELTRRIEAALSVPAPTDAVSPDWAGGENPDTSVPAPTLPELDAIDEFTTRNAASMLTRMRHGARKFGTLSWRNDVYRDEDNLERLRRAVDHLEAARLNTRDPEEWAKRAADVANQAFMFADEDRVRDAV